MTAAYHIAEVTQPGMIAASLLLPSGRPNKPFSRWESVGHKIKT